MPNELAIGFFSDLNLQDSPAVKMSTANLDLLICLGDLRSGPQSARKAIQDLRSISKTLPIIYVPGNQEFAGQTVRDGILALRKAARKTNVRILYRDAVDLAGIRFLGTTLWSDFLLFGADNQGYCEQAVQDIEPDFQHNLGPDGGLWTPEDARMEHDKDIKWIKRHLTKDKTIPKVWLTHFSPSIQSLDKDYSSNMVASYYVSKHDDLVNQTVLTLYGHLPNSKKFTVGHSRKTLVSSNPRGSVREIKDDAGNVVELVPDNPHFVGPRKAYIDLDTHQVRVV